MTKSTKPVDRSIADIKGDLRKVLPELKRSLLVAAGSVFSRLINMLPLDVLKASDMSIAELCKITVNFADIRSKQSPGKIAEVDRAVLLFGIYLEACFIWMFDNRPIKTEDELTLLMNSYSKVACFTGLVRPIRISNEKTGDVISQYIPFAQAEVNHVTGNFRKIEIYGLAYNAKEKVVNAKRIHICAFPLDNTLHWLLGNYADEHAEHWLPLRFEFIDQGEFVKPVYDFINKRYPDGTAVKLRHAAYASAVIGEDGKPVTNVSTRFVLVDQEELTTTSINLRAAATGHFDAGLSPQKYYCMQAASCLQPCPVMELPAYCTAINLDDGRLYKVAIHAIKPNLDTAEFPASDLLRGIKTSPAVGKYLSNLIQTLRENPIARMKVFSRMLLWGPPGFGKSMLATRVCEASGMTLLRRSVASLAVAPEKLGAELYELSSLAIRIKAVIVLDDADYLVGRRQEHAQYVLMAELLRFLDTHTLPVIMTVNWDVDYIDAAILSRQDVLLHIAPGTSRNEWLELLELLEPRMGTELKTEVKANLAEAASLRGTKLPQRLGGLRGSSYRTLELIAKQVSADHRFNTRKSISSLVTLVIEKMLGVGK